MHQEDKNLLRTLIYLIILISSILLTGCASQLQRTATCSCPKSSTQPAISQTALLVWANEAAVSAYSYDFVNYQKQLQAASVYFTPTGWKDFTAFLNSSGTLSSVKDKRLVASAVAADSPIIVSQQIVRGVYTWKVQLPLLATYQSASTRIREPLLITLTIVNTPANIGIRGLAIKEFKVAKQNQNKTYDKSI